MRRALLDENLPRLLKRELPDFKVSTVAEMGWAGLKNGALLRQAEAEFNVLVTADRNPPHQQTRSALELGEVVLVARSTKLEDLSPLTSAIREALGAVHPGQVLTVPQATSR